jgi:beta-lactamase class D
MKKTILLLVLAISWLFSVSAFADTKCFVAKEGDTIVKQEGDCAARHSPCSTFKIAVSLMGYNEGILLDETHPEWPFEVGYTDWMPAWKQPHNPTSWMKNSCVWYSQVITTAMGSYKFKDYIARFDYGNQDISGDKGKNNGLTNSWLLSSLQISGNEQVDFLERLINNKLPVSQKAQELTRNILYLEDLPNGWKLYGKTGSASKRVGSIFRDKYLQMGWFIGWGEKGPRRIIIVHYIEDAQPINSNAGLRAEETAKDKLLEILGAAGSVNKVADEPSEKATEKSADKSADKPNYLSSPHVFSGDPVN